MSKNVSTNKEGGDLKVKECKGGVHGDCGRKLKARGYCRVHYDAYRYGASTAFDIGNKNPPKECKECEDQAKVDGLCRKHFYKEKAQKDKLPPEEGQQECIEAGCEIRQYAKSRCRKHYELNRRKKETK